MKAGQEEPQLHRGGAVQLPGLQPDRDPHHVHAHHHEHDHGHAHAHPTAHSPAHESAPSSASLLMSSATLRLAGAIGLSALLWAAVAWALSGTP